MGNIVRVRRKHGQFLISDAQIHLDHRISYAARGLHAHLMLKPDDWEVRSKELINSSPAGRDAVQRMVKELETFGYLTRERVNDPEKAGKFMWVTTVYETPDLNPTYGGTAETITGYSGNGTITGLSIDGLTVDGKPVPLLNNDLPIEIRGGFPVLEIEDGEFQIPSEDQGDVALNEMVSAMAGTCKGFANWLKPDTCPFYVQARILMAQDITPAEVEAFREWWAENGNYEGQPALKSLMDEIDNFRAGIKKERSGNNGQAAQSWKECRGWISRQITVDQFSDPLTVQAIRKVGEAPLRSLNSSNSRTLRAQYNEAYEQLAGSH